MKKRVCTFMGVVGLLAFAQSVSAKDDGAKFGQFSNTNLSWVSPTGGQAILTEPAWLSVSNSQSTTIATSSVISNSQPMLSSPDWVSTNSQASSPDGITSTEYRRGGGGGGGSSLSAGLQIQYSSYFSGGPSVMGIGLVGELGTDKFAYRFTFVYDFGTSTSYQYQDYATDENFASPNYGQSVPVTETDKYTTSIMNFVFDAKKVFGGDYSAGGFYVFFGVELELISESASVSYSSYDASTYTLSSSGGNSASYSASQFYLRLGLGYDLKLGNGKLFGELGIDLAANSENGQQVDVVIPSFFHIAAGYRISFGGK